MSNPENISSTDLDDARTLVRLEEQYKSVILRLEEAEEAVKELKDDKEKALLWGISLLGAAVLAMGSWILKALGLEK